VSVSSLATYLPSQPDMSMKGLDDFLKNADKADEVPNVERNTARYEDFRISPEEWELCHLIKDFLLV
jgi:hypothetical protein